MGLVNPQQSQPNDTIEASDINTPVNQIAAVVNGNIDATNIAASAITDTQIAAGGLKPTKISNPYKFSVYRNAAWTAGGSLTVVPFDTKVFDTGTNVDVATNKGRFTAPVNGFYFFSGSASSTVTAGNITVTSLFKNGTEALRGGIIDVGSATVNNGSPVSGLLSLAANDYVELAYGGTGGAGQTGGAVTHFEGFLVSAT